MLRAMVSARITGSCIEEVSIARKDDVRLVAVSQSDGITGRIRVSFSRRLVLSNMTVKNCPSADCIGILVQGPGSITLTDVISSGHNGPGFLTLDAELIVIKKW